MNEIKANPMNPSEWSSQHEESQLDWSAFCYAAGELSPAEAEQFEALLAADQPAREALARAVELTQTVVAAESQADSRVVPAARSVADWSARLAWMAVGGLASVLLAVAWSGAGHRAASGPSAKQLALASAWSQARAGIAQAKEDGLWLPATGALGESEDESLVWSDMAAESPLTETPTWMTAALVGLADQPIEASAEPFTNERGEN